MKLAPSPTCNCGGQGDQTAEHILQDCPLLQRDKRFRVAGGNPITNQATWQLAGPGKDSYISFPDWSDGVTSMNAKKKKKILFYFIFYI